VSAPVPYFDDGQVQLFVGDCLDVLAGIPDDSVDAVVTDPPYGLEFMGANWDAPWRSGINADAGFSAPGLDDGGNRLPRPTFTGSTNPVCRNCGGKQRGRRDGTAIWKTCTCDSPKFPNVRATEMRAFQDWCETWAVECLRVLKPGGHLLAFGGTRTWHRLTCAIEDAGFEIRDSITWLYGSGFPKSLDVGKAIDKAAGAERAVIAEGAPMRRMIPGASQNRTGSWIKDDGREFIPSETVPVTEDAARWSGWGTALKPSQEPIVVARKPLAGTVAGNVMTHGTGALNIDGCRVAHASAGDLAASQAKNPGRDDTVTSGVYGSSRPQQSVNDAGRWPSNVLLTHSADCEPAGTRQVKSDGHVPAVTGKRGTYMPGLDGHSAGERRMGGTDRLETVQAWNCAEGCPVAELDRQSGVLTSGRLDQGTIRAANKTYGQIADRGDKVYRTDSGGASRFFPVFRYEAKAPVSERPRLADGTAHPTVKPLALMRWLVRLVTPPGGLVLDPFGGSGTTAEACVIEGFNCILAEKDPAHAELIKARLSKPIQPDLFGGAA
jgi:DNA modification methylase